jgi:hypothetical protein
MLNLNVGVNLAPCAFCFVCFLFVEVKGCLAHLLLGGCVGVWFFCFGFVLVCVLVVQVVPFLTVFWNGLNFVVNQISSFMLPAESMSTQHLQRKT